MRVQLITYANKPYLRSQELLAKSALRYGVSEVVLYNDLWVRSQKDFYHKNRLILTQKRGSGLWLWKPYIILDALKKIADDEVLLYIDSGTEFVSSIDPWLELLHQKDIIFFFNNGHINRVWTKRDCFVFMDCDEEKFHNGFQCVGGYIICRKTPAIIALLEEWLSYAQDERIISDSPNVCGLPNFPEFIDHRHDQSILSNLVIKYNIELFREPSQWGNCYKLPQFREPGEFVDGGNYLTPFENSHYPAILYSHRRKIPLTVRNYMNYLRSYVKMMFRSLKPEIYAKA